MLVTANRKGVSVMTSEQAVSSKFQRERNPMVSAPQIPLAMVSGGETVKVLSIRGKDELQRFLRNLGDLLTTIEDVKYYMNQNI